MKHVFFVTCPKNIEDLLAQELVALGLEKQRLAPAGAWVSGTLEQAYRACLWSRLANRIILDLGAVDARDADTLYAGIRTLPWSDHLDVRGRFRVHFTGRNDAFRNTAFGAQRVKDGIVDCLRDDSGQRPDVDLRNPDLSIHVRLQHDRAHVGIDLAGDSLHRRGYRTESGEAPMKENLAAAMLYRMDWPTLAAAGGDLVDPLCGSGTILVEAALMATDAAPGLLREAFGFERWKGHDDAVWLSLKQEAQELRRAGRQGNRSRFWGFDQDKNVIATAWRNIERAGVRDIVHVERQVLADFQKPGQADKGLMLTNPPYGERLSERAALDSLYLKLGQVAREQLPGWRLGVLTSVPELGHAIGLRCDKRYRLFNGKLPVQLLAFEISDEKSVRPRVADDPSQPPAPRIAQPARAEMFANRMRKNLKALGSWARKQGIECYRLYDADMPEYALAVDCYADWLHVQEYAAPKSIDERAARERLAEALAVLPDVTGIPAERIVCKQRRRQAGTRQYEKQATTAHELDVTEGDCRLRVNLRDYLDTGLFLDHRPVRRWIHENAAGKRFLNLFCYTGAATVQAATGGALSSLSVDMSKTYLDWTQSNLRLNRLDLKRHRVERADCLKWLDAPAQETFDLIFLDPPTFSNSARMEDVLDVQRDHVALVDNAMRRLAPGGVLIFSNNYRRFKLDPALETRYRVTDITSQTIDRDFARNPKIHVCWRFEWP